MDKWQRSWAQNKYWVMLHSQQFYNQIRQLARDNDWTTEKQHQYDQMIEEATQLPMTGATMRTAYQHVWGYFKKIATDEEKDQYIDYLNHLNPEDDQMGPWLAQMAQKYDVKYLLESRLIKELLNNS